MTISLLVAVAENDVIGKQGAVLPWRLPADLKHFKSLTMGHPIIMGRKTYETIGRPLPGRINIVMTHDRAYQAPGCTVVHSLEEALSCASESNPSEVFVIGGGVVFDAVIHQADKLYLTEVHGKPAGDVLFTYNPSDWQEITREDHPADEKNQYAYSFVTLVRKQNNRPV
jgi:dihydrofolate reductase